MQAAAERKEVLVPCISIVDEFHRVCIRDDDLSHRKRKPGKKLPSSSLREPVRANRFWEGFPQTYSRLLATNWSIKAPHSRLQRTGGEREREGAMSFA